MAKKKYHIKRKRSVKVARKKTRRKRGMSEGLSQAFSPSQMQTAGKALLSGAVGGAIGAILSKKMLSDKPLLQKVLILGGAGILFGTVLRMPNVGAGIASQIGADLLAGGTGMSEKNANYLADLPMYLQEGREDAALAEASYLSQTLTPEEKSWLVNNGLVITE